MEKSYKQCLKDITTFVFDVDGVMTNGSVLVAPKGELFRSMNVKDGYALKTAVLKGYNVAIITGGTDKNVKERLESLGIGMVFLGAHHKEAPYRAYLEEKEIAFENVLYMGDDLPDIPPMQLSALATCPQDAAPEVKAVSAYVSHKKGGEGCVRDVIEQVLKVRGDWYSNFNAAND